VAANPQYTPPPERPRDIRPKLQIPPRTRVPLHPNLLRSSAGRMEQANAGAYGPVTRRASSDTPLEPEAQRNQREKSLDPDLELHSDVKEVYSQPATCNSCGTF
jgi:hypothetical protein